MCAPRMAADAADHGTMRQSSTDPNRRSCRHKHWQQSKSSPNMENPYPKHGRGTSLARGAPQKQLSAAGPSAGRHPPHILYVSGQREARGVHVPGLIHAAVQVHRAEHLRARCRLWSPAARAGRVPEGRAPWRHSCGQCTAPAGCNHTDGDDISLVITRYTTRRTHHVELPALTQTGGLLKQAVLCHLVGWLPSMLRPM